MGELKATFSTALEVLRCGRTITSYDRSLCVLLALSVCALGGARRKGAGFGEAKEAPPPPPTAPKTIAHPSGSHIGWQRPLWAKLEIIKNTTTKALMLRESKAMAEGVAKQAMPVFKSFKSVTMLATGIASAKSRKLNPSTLHRLARGPEVVCFNIKMLKTTKGKAKGSGGGGGKTGDSTWCSAVPTCKNQTPEILKKSVSDL